MKTLCGDRYEVDGLKCLDCGEDDSTLSEYNKCKADYKTKIFHIKETHSHDPYFSDEQVLDMVERMRRGEIITSDEETEISED